MQQLFSLVKVVTNAAVRRGCRGGTRPGPATFRGRATEASDVWERGRGLLAAVLVLLLASALHADWNEAYAAVVTDLARLPPEEQLYAIYFWAGDVAEADRIDRIKTLSGAVNALSREPVISVPVPVAKDYSLVRASAKRYAWSFSVLKQLIEAEPYGARSIEVDVLWPGGVWPADGKNYARGSFTAHRAVPVVGLRWFVWQTLQQADRKPGYYDFLDLRDRKDMDALSGFDAKVNAAARRSEYLDTVAHSGVSAQPRRVVIEPVAEGRRYGTEDVDLGVADKNFLSIPDRKLSKHDAEEWIFFLPNDLLGFFLNDAQGKRQDSAPDFIGGRRGSPSNDLRIHNPWACYDCHYGGDPGGSRGLITFEPYFRRLQAARAPIMSPAYGILAGIEQAYVRAFDAALERDRGRHEEAVRQATGFAADVWAKKLRAVAEDYDQGATPAEAAWYLGCSAAELVDGLKDYAAKTGQLNPTLGLWLIGQKIPRHQYHEVFPILRATVNHEIRTLDVRGLLLPVDYRLDLSGGPLPHK